MKSLTAKNKLISKACTFSRYYPTALLVTLGFFVYLAKKLNLQKLIFS